MAQDYNIDIEIVDGKVQATVNGVTGPACGDISKFLDKLGKVVKDEKTEDYDRRVAASTSASVRH